MDASVSEGGPEAEEVLGRLPARFRPFAEKMLERWLGRFVLRVTSTTIRIELFDRSMTIAAQFFTSVFPILILIATLVGGASDKVAETLDMPAQTKSVLEDALADNSSATFGLIGTLIVLISATSLSRALTRAFAAIWELPRPKSKLMSAWRWVAVVLTLALALIATRAVTRIANEIPPPVLWQIVGLMALYVAMALFVPWILLQGAVPLRQMLPAALIFGAVMMAMRPVSLVWLPRALETSADRYGSIGVAFTYLAWLYAVSFCFLAAQVVGEVLATDRGGFGRWIRGEPRRRARKPQPPAS